MARDGVIINDAGTRMMAVPGKGGTGLEGCYHSDDDKSRACCDVGGGNNAAGYGGGGRRRVPIDDVRRATRVFDAYKWRYGPATGRNAAAEGLNEGAGSIKVSVGHSVAAAV